MVRTWEDNAREFGALSKQGVDVRLAVLVACSVEKSPHGGDRKSSNSRNLIEKVTATRFAEAAGTSVPRVLRHLDAWNRASDLNHCPAADELSPADALDPELVVPDEEKFRLCYVVPENAGGRTMGNIKTAVLTIEKRGAQAVVDALTPEQRADFTEQLIQQADPITLHTMQKAVERTAPAAPIVDLSEQRREAVKRAEAEGRARHSERYLDIDAKLSRARTFIADARNEARGVEFSDWEREDLTETVVRLIGDAGLLRVLISGESGQDLDAGLADLLKAEGK